MILCVIKNIDTNNAHLPALLRRGFFMPFRVYTKPIDANYLTNGEGLKNASKSK